MDDQLQALDQVRSAAIDLGMKFGPKLFGSCWVCSPSWRCRTWGWSCCR